MPEAVIRTVPSPTALLASLDPLLRQWLPRRRWFAGKGRPVTGLSPVAATRLPSPAPDSDGAPGALTGLYHLLVRVHQPPAPGSPERLGDCYQLVIGVREVPPTRPAPGLIGHVTRGPLAGHVVYDALDDPRPAGVLLEALRSGARIGPLRFDRVPGHEIRTGLVPRRMTAEQSNSSVVYGDRLVLKVLRRIGPGTHPDLELPLALARAGCGRVPAPVGWMTAELSGESWLLGVLQPYVQGAADGWELALRELAKGEDFAAEARALGRATAEVHTALARALPTVALGHRAMARIADGMSGRLAEAVRTVPALLPYAPGLRSAFTALGDLAGQGRTWTAQRVHGDLHLGQCLRSPDGEWSLIDFEGEPDRPPEERRMPQPAVRDVAGMLRSFDYAARSADTPVPGWAETCRAAYCSGYARVAGHDPRTDPVLLRAFETDKAVYEVVYEARHRPDWLPVPMAAVRRLAAPAPARPLS